MTTDRPQVEVVYDNLPPGIGAKWRYAGEADWHLEKIPEGAAGILINRRYPERERLQKANDLNSAVLALLDPLHELGKLYHSVLAELAPLDEMAHDIALEAADDSTTHKVDPIGKRYKSAKSHAEQSLKHLLAAMADLEGLMRGENKDRYEEPVNRAVQGAALLLAKMEELNQRYENEERNKPYVIRKSRLSGLIVKLDEFLKNFQGTKRLDRNFEPQYLSRLLTVENRFKQMKRRLSKLRDNPSQKMAVELRALAEELDLIHEEVFDLQDCTDTWSSGSGYKPKLRWCFEDRTEKPSVTAAKMLHWKKHHSTKRGDSVWTDFTSRCKHCWPDYYEAGSITPQCLAVH